MSDVLISVVKQAEDQLLIEHSSDNCKIYCKLTIESAIKLRELLDIQIKESQIAGID